MSAMQGHLAAVNFGAVNKTNVIGIRKAINHVERLRAGWSGNRSSATIDEVLELEEALARMRPTVVGELHESGLKVLRNPRYAKRFNETQRAIIEARHVRFDLVRFDRTGRRGMYAVPVYRVSSFAGEFYFRNIPWQSGGDGPEIVGEDFTS